MSRLALLALLVVPTLAHADILLLDPPGVAERTDDLPGRDPSFATDGYVAAGILTGKDRHELMAFSGEVGARFERSPVFARAMAVAGTTNLRSGRGTYWEARGGLEARHCSTTGRLCGSAGVDLGVHRASFESNLERSASFQKRDVEVDDGRLDSVIAVPRLTLDGGARVRVRAVLELPYHVREGEDVRGYAFSLALGLGF